MVTEDMKFIVGRKIKMAETKEAKMKKFLISRIDELNKGDFLRDIEDEDLGVSNIHRMGSIALSCDCYTEFRLFMEYKKVKVKGWRKKNERANKKQTLADEVIADLDEIFSKCDKDDEETLRWISQYFGYFYWKKASLGKPRKKEDNRNASNKWQSRGGKENGKR